MLRELFPPITLFHSKMAKRTQSTTVETKEFLRELASETATNKRFQHIRTDQTFVIENLEAAEDPVKILRQCFQECIDRTLEKSREAGMESDQKVLLYLRNYLHMIYGPLYAPSMKTLLMLY